MLDDQVVKLHMSPGLERSQGWPPFLSVDLGAAPTPEGFIDNGASPVESRAPLKRYPGQWIRSAFVFAWVVLACRDQRRFEPVETRSACVERAAVRRLHHAIFDLEHAQPVDDYPQPLAGASETYRTYNRMVAALQRAESQEAGARRRLLEALRVELADWECLTPEMHESFHQELGIAR